MRHIELDVCLVVSIYHSFNKHSSSFIFTMDSWLIHSSPSASPPTPETSPSVLLRPDRRIRGVVYVAVDHTVNLRRGSTVSAIWAHGEYTSVNNPVGPHSWICDHCVVGTPVRITPYPDLRQWAWNVLSIPATSAEVARVFSIAHRTLTDDRNRLLSEMVSILVCMNMWWDRGLVAIYDLHFGGEEATRLVPYINLSI